MRFTRLRMKDFRGIRELDIDLEPDMTVIVGRNGAGKTSILDALAQFALLLRSHLKGPRRGGMDAARLPSRDVRLGAKRFALDLEFGAEGPGHQKDVVRVEEASVSIKYDADSDTLSYGYSERLHRWSDEIESQPRFIHYRQERGFESREHHQADDDARRVLDPETVQDLSLKEDIRAIVDLEAWWDRRDAEEARRVRDDDPNHRDPQLEAVRELIEKIDSFSDIYFSSTSSPPGLHFVKNDGTRVHASGLSGGERSYIILLADLARRLQVFAPDRPLGEIPAVVLIDEMELNLHPVWQSEIAPTLTGVFGACQFIVSTHSPQVLSGVESRNVRILEQESSGTTKATTPLDTRGRTSNYLLEGVFGASERHPPIDRLIDEFNGAIGRGDADAAKAKLSIIEDEIKGDTTTLLILRKRLKKLRNGE